MFVDLKAVVKYECVACKKCGKKDFICKGDLKNQAPFDTIYSERYAESNSDYCNSLKSVRVPAGVTSFGFDHRAEADCGAIAVGAETIVYIVEGSYADKVYKECYNVDSVAEIEYMKVAYYTPE